MKDAEPPALLLCVIYRSLGWVDEDGENISGAVFTLEDNPPTKKDKKKSHPLTNTSKCLKMPGGVAGALKSEMAFHTYQEADF